MKKREGTNWYWAYRSKRWSWNNENAFDFICSEEQQIEEEDIGLANFIENNKS